MPSASKTITIYSNGGNAYYLRAEFTETSTSTPNNTSTLTCKASLIPTNAYWSTSYSSSLAIYWHDNRENTDRLVNSINFSGINSGETKSTEGSITIYHKEDGSLSGYAYAYFTKGSTTSSYAPNSAGVSTDWTALTSISRYPMITSAPNFNDEQNPTITYTTTSGFSSAIYTACISLTGATDDVPYRTIDLNAGSYTFELTETERNTLRYAARNSNTINVIFYLRTIVGNTNYLSTATRTLSIVNAEPTHTHSEVETNQDVINLLGSSATSVIKNVSELEITITPIAQKYATISSVKLNSGSFSQTKTSSPYTFNVPVTQQSFAYVTTDSRGNGSANVFTKTLIDYEPVNINNFSFQRYNPTSSNIILNMEADYFQQTFGSTVNVPVVKWKLEDGSYTTIPSSNYTIDTTNHKLTITNYELTNALVYTSAGQFTIYIEDLLTSDQESGTNGYVTKGIPTFDEGEHDLQVNGDLYVADIDGNNPINILEYLLPKYIMATETTRWTQNFTAWVYTPLKIGTSDTNDSSMFVLDAQNRKITIGSGVSKVEISGGVSWFDADTNGEFDVTITKNGIILTGGVSNNVAGTYTNHSNISPLIVNVEQGDYFQIELSGAVSSATIISTKLYIKKIS